MLDKRETKKFEEFTRELTSGNYKPQVKDAVVDLCAVIAEVPRASPARLNDVQARLSNAAWLLQRSMRTHMSHREHRLVLGTRPAFFGDLVTGHQDRQVAICKEVGEQATKVWQKYGSKKPEELKPIAKATPRGVTN